MRISRGVLVAGFVGLGALVAGAAPADRPPGLPPGVVAYRDMAYVEGGHERQKLDLFVPTNAPAPRPLIIWVHGGGWLSGTKEGCPPLRQGFPGRGYAVASVGYRLSGDATFPAQIEDVKTAVRWLRAHAADYGLDPARFGAWGSSAGGHLVALLGTSGETVAFDVGAPTGVSSRVQAVCDYYGPTDLLQMDAHALAGATLKHDAPDSPESRLLGGPVQESREKAAKASPLTYVTSKAPPFLIVHGDADPLVPRHQSVLLYEALKAAGVPVRFHTIRGAGHGQGFGGSAILDMVVEFFDRSLKGDPAGPPAGASRTESDAIESPQYRPAR